MVYILNKSYSKDLKLLKVLQTIFGIGYHRAVTICYLCGSHIHTKIGELNENQLRIVLTEIKKLGDIDQELKKIINLNIKKKKIINCNQGIRYSLNLPIRGQRTHTNGRTAKRINIRNE